MKLRKDVLIAVLVTFCLTSALFAIKPIGSQTQRQYDPWADVNDDGIINMRDVVNEILLFNTVGDPTKPVIINHNWSEGNYSFNLPPNGDVNFNISTRGFKTVTIYVYAAPSYFVVYKFQLLVGFGIENKIIDYEVHTVPAYITIHLLPPPPWACKVDKPNFEKTYNITFSRLTVWIWNNSTDYGLSGTVYYYLST
jgi:hypothetical protein